MVVAALDLADRIAEAMDVAPNWTRTLLTTLKTVGLHTIVAGSQFADEFGEVPELDFTEPLSERRHDLGCELLEVLPLVGVEVDINALSALAPLPGAPVPRPSRPQPRTPQPRWSRRHSAHWPPHAPTAPARL